MLSSDRYTVDGRLCGPKDDRVSAAYSFDPNMTRDLPAIKWAGAYGVVVSASAVGTSYEGTFKASPIWWSPISV